MNTYFWTPACGQNLETNTIIPKRNTTESLLCCEGFHPADISDQSTASIRDTSQLFQPGEDSFFFSFFHSPQWNCKLALAGRYFSITGSLHTPAKKQRNKEPHLSHSLHPREIRYRLQAASRWSRLPTTKKRASVGRRLTSLFIQTRLLRSSFHGDPLRDEKERAESSRAAQVE